MATELDRSTAAQALADSTALIYDRAISPERLVGQAWLISKGRVVTLASTVSNYIDAPWALIVRFPHPDLTYAARTVQVHPDFNKREARDHYLSQASGFQAPISFENDIATIALDSDLSPPAPERLAELNRALAVPFEISSRDMSGAIRPGDMPAIIQSAVSTGRSGLLTMLDQRNIPFARIGIKQARVSRVTYKTLTNEVALCELLWQKPPGNFAFQPIENYRWPADMPELATTVEQIIGEGQRRADELASVIGSLGGVDARFIRATPYADFSASRPNERWIAERLWECIDGTVPLGKLAERIGSDTYSTVRMLWDFANMGLITPNPTNVFHCSGQPGPMLVPAQELELQTWDNLTAMYLDPISSGPVLVEGNLFGPARVISNKSLLHTIGLPAGVNTAAVFKEGRLVGIYSGAYTPKAGQNQPPVPLFRMTWVGALADLGAKRLRTNEVAIGEPGEQGSEATAAQDQVTSQRLSLRTRAATFATEQEAAQQEQSAKETGILAKFTKQQIAMGAGGVFALSFIMLLVSIFTPHGGSSEPAPQTATNTSTATTTASTSTDTTANPATGTTTGAPSDPKIGDAVAADMAQKFAGFGHPPETCTYKDSSELTKPRESWELISDAKNLDILFVAWPNNAPLLSLDSVSGNVPYLNIFRVEQTNEFKGDLENVHYVGGHYYMNAAGDTVGTVVIGSFPMKNDPKRCIVFFAKAMTGNNVPDLMATATFVDGLVHNAKGVAAPPTATATPKPAETVAAGPAATPEELAAYRKKVEELIQSNFKAPKADDDSKSRLSFTVDSTGAISDLTIKQSPNEDVNTALQHALDQSKPFPAAPSTKNGKYALKVTAQGTKISVEEQ